MSLIMNLFLKFFKKIKNEKGDVAIEYFVIAAVIIVGIVAVLYALRDQLILLIENITDILTLP
ncbi:MAG: hypothetical protein KKC53_06630 [Actinobacteria bacterium]|uniref:Flp/Fap pilin component n=1 Tax=marine sediment metagenome TaxID=412755 RepID=X0Z443_9ZZZZ|nr:hypothetical protein [Actinomycetota bacterium]